MQEKEKDIKTKKKYGTADNIRYILSELWKCQPAMFILLTAELLAAVGNSLLTTFTGKYVVELAMGSAPRKRLAVICLLLIAGERLTDFIRNESSDYRLYVGNDRFLYFLKRRLIRKNMSADYESNESCAKSDALKKAESGSGYSAFQTTETLNRAFMAVLTLIAYGSILSFLHPLMLLIVGVPSVISYYIERHNLKWVIDKADSWQRYDRELMYIQSAASDFAYAKDIRIYGMAGWLESAFARSFGKRLEWYRQQDERAFRHDMARMLTVHISNLAAYVFVITQVVRGSIGAGDFVLFFGSVAAFGAAVRDVFDRFSQFELLSGNITCMREYLDTENKTNRAEGEKLPSGGCEIEFRNVSYRYGGADDITLRNISFTLHSGEKLALVGLNGAGKTTLIKLMCGMYDPTEGEILLNGKPVGSYNREGYFTLFSAVFQDITELPVSIAENISDTSYEQTDMERLTRCMKQAGIYEKVMSLPEKEKTPLVRSVHENAIELSGGQKQSFALARALYKDAPLLILDEPTAALDPIAEQKMYRRYADFSKGKTSVFISHRLASTRFCDRILMIENGSITEEGTHEQLMRQGGKYAELYGLQSSYYNDGEVQSDE